jgi:hypothetical protein
MKLCFGILFFSCALSAMAQTALKTSPAYPLEARIIAVEKQTSAYPDSTRATSAGGGGTYEWHLMKTIIGDKLYGLAVDKGLFARRNVLEVGTYPARKVNGGFDVAYKDDNGKIQHEVLVIKSEEPAPPAK